MRIKKTRVMADTDVDVDVAPEAQELLFEAEDVADLVAEVTGEDVAVETTDTGVEFTVGDDDVYHVEPEGDEEILESSTRMNRKARAVKARAVKASTQRNARRVVRRAAR